MNTQTMNFEDLNFDAKKTVGQDLNLTMVLDGAEEPDELASNPTENFDGVVTLGSSIGSPVGYSDRPRFVYQTALGEGAYGKVWKASDTDLGRSVAIKTYKMTGLKGYRLCNSEVSIAAKIEHPGVPVLYDVEKTSDGEYHYIMKYVDGRPLDKLIKELAEDSNEAHERFHVEQRLSLLIQILRVLATVHKNGIVHRDIKPENIMVGPNGEAYLMDWGIALDTNQNNGSGQFAGSPMYMSPEQSRKEALDGRSDLFSLGVTMYELLTLEQYAPTFSSLEELISNVSTFSRNHSDFPKSDTQQGKELAMHIRNVIVKACKLDKSERHQTAEDFIKDIEDAIAGRFDPSCPITALSKFTFHYQRQLDTRPVATFLLSIGGMLAFSAIMIAIGLLM